MMTMVRNNSQLTVRLLNGSSPEIRYKLLSLCKNYFVKEESTCRLAKLLPQEQNMLSKIIVDHYTKTSHGYNLGCFNANGDLVAFSLNDRYSPYASTWDTQKMTPRIAKIFEFYKSVAFALDESLDKYEPVFDIGYLAVKVDYRRLGIPAMLIELSEEQARENGCKYCTALPTSLLISKILEKRGYTMICDRPHKDFLDGSSQMAFKDAKEADFGRLYLLRL